MAIFNSYVNLPEGKFNSAFMNFPRWQPRRSETPAGARRNSVDEGFFLHQQGL